MACSFQRQIIRCIRMEYFISSTYIQAFSTHTIPHPTILRYTVVSPRQYSRDKTKPNATPVVNKHSQGSCYGTGNGRNHGGFTSVCIYLILSLVQIELNFLINSSSTQLPLNHNNSKTTNRILWRKTTFRV